MLSGWVSWRIYAGLWRCGLLWHTTKVAFMGLTQISFSVCKNNWICRQDYFSSILLSVDILRHIFFVYLKSLSNKLLAGNNYCKITKMWLFHFLSFVPKYCKSLTIDKKTKLHCIVYFFRLIVLCTLHFL